MSTSSPPPLVEGRLTRRQRAVSFAAGIFWILIAWAFVFPGAGGALYSVLFTGMAGAAAFHSLRRALQSAPLLVIDETGIHDQTSLLAGPLAVPWHEIREVSASSLRGTVEVEIRDLTAVSQSSGLRRRVVAAVSRLLGRHKVLELRTKAVGQDPISVADIVNEKLDAVEREQLGLGSDPGELPNPRPRGGAF